jgi:hypothetical protein
MLFSFLSYNTRKLFENKLGQLCYKDVLFDSCDRIIGVQQILSNRLSNQDLNESLISYAGIQIMM